MCCTLIKYILKIIIGKLLLYKGNKALWGMQGASHPSVIDGFPRTPNLIVFYSLHTIHDIIHELLYVMKYII